MHYGPFITRIGLAGLLVWFGYQQLMYPIDWVGYVPAEVLRLGFFDARTFVLLNGSVELACAAMLFLGLYTRIVAGIMGAHLVLIAFSLGNSAVAIRDWGLAFAFFGLMVTGPGAYAMDSEEDSLHLY